MGFTDFGSVLFADDLDGLPKSLFIGADDLVEPGTGITDIRFFLAGKWFREWVYIHCW